MFYSGFLYFFYLDRKKGHISVGHSQHYTSLFGPYPLMVLKKTACHLRLLYSFIIRFSLTLFLVIKIYSATPGHCFIGGI